MPGFTRYFLHLPVQLAVFMIGITALTAAAAGLPAVWLLREQMEQQSRQRVEQGGRTLEAGLHAEASDLVGAALLIAQRPTLHRLLENDNPAALQTYLEGLRSGADLGMVVICHDNAPPTAAADPAALDPHTSAAAEEFCKLPEGSRIRLIDGDGAWLYADQPLEASTGDRVVVARALDAPFMGRLQALAGLEAAVLIDGQYAAGSFADGKQAAAAVGSAFTAGPAGQSTAAEFSLGEDEYHAYLTPFGDDRVQIVAALSTAEIAAAQAELMRTLGLAIVGVLIAASLSAYYLALRLSRPLERLRVAAVKLRRGDLVTPVGTRTKVREIAQVAYALEDARSVLQHSLDALRREKEWSDHLLGSMVEGIVTLDRKGRITFFSQGAERISGQRRAAAFGKHIDEVFPLAPDVGHGRGETFSCSLPEAGAKPALLNVQAQGRTVTLAVTQAHLAPPETGRSASALVLRDVSDEDAVRRLLGDFLANITHEFRTPLSALAAGIELMLDQLPDLSQDELRELLDSLRLGTLSLQTLIDNLLEGAGIEAGRFRVYPRPAEIGDVMREAARTMRPLVEKYGQTLALNIPEGLPSVRIDSRRTGQALINLLSNAVKWSPPGAEITLEARKEPEAVRVTVGDCGPGIPDEQLPDLFTRFAHLKIDDPRAEYGAGLGLSVVKAIVEAQGGSVGVENRPGGGAAFWFTASEAE